jgi:hypothetical protein
MLDRKTTFNFRYTLFALWGVLILHDVWVKATQIA